LELFLARLLRWICRVNLSNFPRGVLSNGSMRSLWMMNFFTFEVSSFQCASLRGKKRLILCREQRILVLSLCGAGNSVRAFGLRVGDNAAPGRSSAVMWLQQMSLGTAFRGMLFIHFRGQYCLVEAACKEGSPAGTREAALKPQLVREGKVRVRKAPFYKRPFSREATEYLDGWFRDPYDSSYRGAILCSVTDNEGFDSQFPDHPLSRLRSILKSVRSTLRSADAPPSIR